MALGNVSHCYCKCWCYINERCDVSAAERETNNRCDGDLVEKRVGEISYECNRH